MIIDSHFHLEPDLLSTEKLIADMEEHQIEKTALIASMCSNLSEPPSFLLKILRFLITRNWSRNFAKLLLTQFTSDGNIKLPGGIVTIESDPDNEPVFNAAEKYPDRFMAWVFVNPKGKNGQEEEFQKWISHPACTGVKTHPFWHQYRPVELLPVASKAAEAGKPMLMHVGFDDHGDVISLIKKVPNLKLILAHAGFPYYSQMWKKIKPYPNIFVDISATAYVDEKITRDALDFLGEERCIFGTDGPFGSTGKDGEFDYGIIKKRCKKLISDEVLYRRVVSDNFLDLIK